ncbi:MAG: hypothetical protein JW891_10640 [Candidatus Lokiarchaeota archaeon]|nr:hypothetical protein [Candidatus Lokiarchaeota archaeon]
MSLLLDKIKGLIGGNELQEIIKDFSDIIKIETNMIKSSKERISSLQNYAKVETPTLREAIESLGETFENIDGAREEKIDQMHDKFLTPLNDLLEEFKELSTELKESEKAKKDLEKAKSKLTKLKSKPKEKLKPGQMESAETAVKDGETKVQKEETEAKEASVQFNRKKVSILKAVLEDIITIEKTFHEKVINLINPAQEKAKAIDLDEKPAEVPE